MENDYKITMLDEHTIQNKIYTLRGLQVMLDRDLAELYGVETKAFNQAVKRNSVRFPADFMFQLTKEELENWRSQFVTSNKEKMGLRRAPYAFTEQGVSMLSAVLKSSAAVDMSVKIIRTFVNMRKFITNNGVLFQKIDTIEQKLLKHDEKFNQLFNAIQSKEFSASHDRFLILDEEEIYHIGASLKDLGKKWFAFSKFEKGSLEMLGRLEG